MPPPSANRDALRLTLGRLRAERQFSYDRLSELSGVSRAVVIDVEHGRSAGSVETWHRLAHALGINFGDLMAHACEGHTPAGAPD